MAGFDRFCGRYCARLDPVNVVQRLYAVRIPSNCYSQRLSFTRLTAWCAGSDLEGYIEYVDAPASAKITYMMCISKSYGLIQDTR
jgi:hypothetical protein